MGLARMRWRRRVGRARWGGAVVVGRCVGGGRGWGGEEGVVVWEGGHCVCGRQREACTCGRIASGDGGEGEDAATGSAGGRWGGRPGRGP